MTLSAIDATVFSATIVDTFIYDTAKDSDGGAWRHRCGHTSWEAETLSGNWLGSAANETAARAISGATTGSYYYDTTALGFYTLDSGSGKTATYRGNVAKCPAIPIGTAESARVVVWDGTQADVPMWRVFDYAGKTITAIAMLDGQMVVATTTGVFVENLVADDIGNAEKYTTATTPAIVNNSCNDVAMTVLPNAPVDPATGLPVPTIAVATDGGVSVIKDDGNVWDITATSYSIAGKVMFRNDNKLAFTLDNATVVQRQLHVYNIPSADVSTGAPGYQKGAALEFYANELTWTPDLVVSPLYSGSTVYRVTDGGVGSETGMAMLHENPASPTDGMVAYVTKDYNSGWMVGDIKGAWLADTTAETLTTTDADRSVNGNDLTVNGSLTKSAVASGAELMGYSGFSATDYLEQPYNADLDFGTGDFYVMGWLIEQPNTGAESILSRCFWNGAAWVDGFLYLRVESNGELYAYFSDDGLATLDSVATGVTVDDGVPRLLSLVRRGAEAEVWINGSLSVSFTLSAAIGSLSSSSAPLKLGLHNDDTLPLTNGTLALWRAGAGAPSAEQIAKIYRDELPLFQANAACTLAGSSNAVTALAYDDVTDLLHVGTSYGRSTFHGLELVESEATAVGAITALSAVGGVIAQGGATAVDVYVPAQNLREELARGDEHAAKGIEFFDFTATASQTDFALDPGWAIVAVYQQGALKRETTSWTREFNGFYWTAVLGTGATVSDWVSIMARRTK